MTYKSVPIQFAGRGRVKFLNYRTASGKLLPALNRDKKTLQDSMADFLDGVVTISL